MGRSWRLAADGMAGCWAAALGGLVRRRPLVVAAHRQLAEACEELPMVVAAQVHEEEEVAAPARLLLLQTPMAAAAAVAAVDGCCCQ